MDNRANQHYLKKSINALELILENKESIIEFAKNLQSEWEDGVFSRAQLRTSQKIGDKFVVYHHTGICENADFQYLRPGIVPSAFRAYGCSCIVFPVDGEAIYNREVYRNTIWLNERRWSLCEHLLTELSKELEESIKQGE